jgi:hypothetical protein
MHYVESDQKTLTLRLMLRSKKSAQFFAAHALWGADFLLCTFAMVEI